MNAVLDFLSRRTNPDAQVIIVPTHEELVLRVDALAHELRAARAEIRALKAAADGKVPTLDESDSPRKLMACIGRAMGNTGDTAHLPVRNHLLKSPAFAPLREALAARGTSITADEKILRWLAGKSRMDASQTRFELILRGAYTARSLAVAEL